MANGAGAEDRGAEAETSSRATATIATDGCTGWSSEALVEVGAAGGAAGDRPWPSRQQQPAVLPQQPLPVWGPAHSASAAHGSSPTSETAITREANLRML